MVNLNEVAPVEQLFDGVERIEKKDLIGKSFDILAFAGRSGSDGDFGVILINHAEKELSTTLSGFLTERLTKALDKVGRDMSKGNDGEIYFKEAVSVKLVERQSGNGKKYFDFE